MPSHAARIAGAPARAATVDAATAAASIRFPGAPRDFPMQKSPSRAHAGGARHAMTRGERRATTGLAAIFGLRMLGMFVILPVFALYAEKLPGGSSHTLVGIALGAYALSQAILQVPFGWASDRFSRKGTIVVGLVIFALGSFLAAWAPDIWWTIAGRTLQGAGAISAAVIALAADLTRDEVRTKAMAVIGMTIGGTFAISLVAGPLLRNLIGVPGIFALTGVLALAAIFALRLVPDAERRVASAAESGFPAFLRVLGNRELLRLNYGIFALHGVLMALFVQIPFQLRDSGLPVERHWQVYLGVLVVSVLLMLPALRAADRPERGKQVFIGAVALLAIAELVLALAGNALAALVAGLVAFFTAFNLLEATLPSLVSKFAPAALKGTAIGVYSSVQFLGTFVGAAVGGALAQHLGPAAVFAFGIVTTLVWVAVSVSMAPPPALRSSISMGES